MSLIGALNAGKSALATHQAALQVTGNNIANAGNADYTRQVARITPGKEQELRPGIFLGSGVNLDAVTRQIDEALAGRLRGSNSNAEAAGTLEQWMGRIESVYNELTDDDLSSHLSGFFNAWSNLANKPQDQGLRQVVLQTGESVAGWFQSIRTGLSNLQNDADSRLVNKVADADRLAQQVANLNQQIVVAEGGSGGQANALRDQRDVVLKDLSGLLEIKTTEESSGIVNVYVGSEPLVIGTNNRGLALKKETVDGKLTSSVIFKADRGTVKLNGGGEIGALSAVRGEHLNNAIDTLDTLAGNFIFELNKLHAGGQGLSGLANLTADNSVADATIALNDPKADLDFQPVNGSFVVHVKNKATGLMTSTMVKVNLGGSGVQTSLNSLTADLDGIDNISAQVINGKLKLSADSPAVELSFSQDSSGTLAALGINNFFTGSDAHDVAVSELLKKSPSMIAASATGDDGDNQTALSIASLESLGLKSLDGMSLKDKYQSMINGISTAAASARTNASAAQAVQETLSAQRESLSGVSLDEEAVNMIRQQRAFQGAAKLVSAIDEMMRTIIGMV